MFQAKQFRALLLGGVLPAIAFTVIEETYGTLWGLIAGMIFGVGEILWEAIKLKRVEPITWLGNGMLLVLGGVSLLTQEGVWFKLQPAILEVLMAFGMLGAVFYEKFVPKEGPPLLIKMGRAGETWERIPPATRPLFVKAFHGVSIRFGVFFLLHAALTVWAALYTSSRVWALIKGVGFTVTFLVYLVAESLFLRYRLRNFTPQKKTKSDVET